MSDHYTLRDRDEQEIVRLRQQHEVWTPEVTAWLHRAGFGKGDRVLDVGCGPGFLSMELAEAVGASGLVHAMDNSERFVAYLRAQAATRALTHIRTEVASIEEGPPQAEGFDGTVCRWVLMHLTRPADALRHIAAALRPGGTLAVFDYLSVRTMSLWPRSDSFDRVFAAVHEMIADSGGHPDIGGHAPALLSAAGFEIVDLRPVVLLGRPGSPVWEWAAATRTHHDGLVNQGRLTAEDVSRYDRDWADRSANQDALVVSPITLAITARLGAPAAR